MPCIVPPSAPACLANAAFLRSGAGTTGGRLLKSWSEVMSRVWSFLLGVVVGAVLFHVASNYHVVRSNEGFAVIAKSPPRLAESFVDIRSFSASDWSGHPQLASALVQANKQHLIVDPAVNAIQQSVNQLLPDSMRQ
jgi:hypothetical protein